MTLRPYQQEAHDRAVEMLEQTTAPVLIEAATGAGKSHIIASIAETIHRERGGKILCLAPNKELTEQNHRKYLMSGNRASIFSASAGEISTRFPVIYGTPGTVKNRIRRFKSGFSLIVVDEAHGITPTIKYIIDEMRDSSPDVRVLGLSATPFRLGSGYIYAVDAAGRPMSESRCVDPYFTKCVYSIRERALIDMGFLSPPVVMPIGASGYDTSTLAKNIKPTGRFREEDVDRAYHGHGRKTSLIVGDIVHNARNKKGVIIFAATVQHAAEIVASLPPALTGCVTDKTKRKDRALIVNRFKAQELKYLVNVSVFTTGFDAPHLDMVCFLRLTESVGLFEQMRGRGSRLCEGKDNYEIYDYAGNIELHCPDGDLFARDIRAKRKKKGETPEIEAACESCGTINSFRARENKEGFPIDENGYYLDLAGRRIPSEFGPIPAHYGRRCFGLSLEGSEMVRCSYRWTHKECPECAEPNDIAARYCATCKAEIIDPNEKLKADYKAFKKDPHNIQTDVVVSYTEINTVTRKGKPCQRIDFITEHRSLSYWIFGHNRASQLQYSDAKKEGIKTITYKKDENTGFYRIFAYNKPEDAEPTGRNKI